MVDKSTIVRSIQTVAPLVSGLAPDLAARWLERLFTTPQRWPRPAREEPWVAAAESTALPFDARRSLKLYTWGSGPVVLLVHGWSGRGSQMGAFAAPLARRGFRVVAFDAPGHGQSDGARSALPEFTRAIERVAAHVGPVHGIVAHSMGTSATTIALHRGLRAQRVVYIAPPDRPGRYLERAGQWLGFSEVTIQRTQRRLERRYAVRFEDASGPRLAEHLRVPLLAIHDEDDAEVPHAEGRALVEHWPGAKLSTVHGLGHRRILREEAVVHAVVDFIDDDDAAPGLSPRGIDQHDMHEAVVVVRAREHEPLAVGPHR